MADETILIVEDNDLMRQGLKVALEVDGFQVIAAVNGLDALEKMRANTPDLILSDIAMPIMVGYTFLEAVRSQVEWVTIPFVFLTARGEREDIFEGKKLGAEDYLVKPVSRRDLVTTIRARLSRNNELQMAQLENAYQLSLIMLSNAIELRDEYTRGHVERVMDYSLALGNVMGLDKDQIKTMQFGSILHDIGKIHIREGILKKPGPLDSAEWDEIKRHPVIGAEMIKNIPFLSAAAPVVRYHHERWDGKGYPDALVGQDIPKTARIVAVADSLDALTTHRIYRRACNPDQAYAEIMAGSGTRYDPDVVTAFRSIWGQLLKRLNHSELLA
jgi:putative two-component system response regulator